jgi:hypothetical protein
MTKAQRSAYIELNTKANHLLSRLEEKGFPKSVRNVVSLQSSSQPQRMKRIYRSSIPYHQDAPNVQEFKPNDRNAKRARIAESKHSFSLIRSINKEDIGYEKVDIANSSISINHTELSSQSSQSVTRNDIEVVNNEDIGYEEKDIANSSMSINHTELDIIISILSICY